MSESAKIVRLEDLLESIRTGPFGSALHAAEYISGGTPIVNPQHYASGTIEPDLDVTVASDVASRLSVFALQQGDVVVARRGEMGRCAVVQSAQVGWLLGTGSAALRVGSRLTPQFLSYFLRSPGTIRALTKQSVGSTMANLNQQVLLGLPCFVPSVAEQDQIVAEIEKQFTRLDVVVSTLQRVKANFRRARASVLKAAVEGRLVPTEAENARAQGRGYEPASALLARILDERQARWPKGKNYKPPGAPDTEGLHELPEGWAWASVAALCVEVTDGDHQPPPVAESGIPFLVIGNVRGGVIDFDECRHVSPDYYNALDWKRRPDSADLLYTTVGSLGIPVRIASDDAAFCVQRHIAILKAPLCDTREYLFWALSSTCVFRQATEKATGTAQKTLGLAGLRAIAIPLPPLAEQTRIVAEVERRLSVLDNLASTIDRKLAHCKHLRQSILKRAFEGKLVPQDPTDEPASALLARIQKTAKSQSA